MNVLPMMPPKSKFTIENEVTSILNITQPDALFKDVPVEIDYIYENFIPDQYNIFTGYADLLKDFGLGGNILGFTDGKKRQSYVDKSLIDSCKKSTIRRGRSTIAHECYHCISHVPFLNFYSSTQGSQKDLFYRKAKDLKPYVNPEWQAWHFAGSILMPQNRVLKYINMGLSIQKMSDLFDVNPAFVNVRIKKLKQKNQTYGNKFGFFA